MLFSPSLSTHFKRCTEGQYISVAQLQKKDFFGSLGSHKLACLLLTLKCATHDGQSLLALTLMRSMVEKHSHIYSQGNLTDYLY